MVKINKLFFILMLTLIFIFPCSLSWAVSPDGEQGLCSEIDLPLIAQDLGKYQICKDEVTLYRQANTELEKQIELLKERNKLTEQEVGVLKETITQYKDLLDFQQKSYKEILKASRPNPIKEAGKAAGWIGIGILLAKILSFL